MARNRTLSGPAEPGLAAHTRRPGRSWPWRKPREFNGAFSLFLLAVQKSPTSCPAAVCPHMATELSQGLSLPCHPRGAALTVTGTLSTRVGWIKPQGHRTISLALYRPASWKTLLPVTKTVVTKEPSLVTGGQWACMASWGTSPVTRCDLQPGNNPIKRSIVKPPPPIPLPL